MHRTRRLRARTPVLLLLLSLAACDRGGGSAGIARPEQMEVNIISGKGMHLPVRDPATPPSDPGLTPEPVVARVSLTPEAGATGGADATGPGRLRLPPVEIHWRVLEPWCSAEHTVTPVRNDTASNFYHRPTRAFVCHLVAEGVLDGRVFGADTTVASFDAGPAVTFQPASLLLLGLDDEFPVSRLVRGPLDFYGNPTLLPPFTAILTSGAPVLAIEDDTMLVSGLAEGSGNMRVTVGARTADIPVWVLRQMRTHWWHVSWECYGLQLSGGAYADSAHYRLDAGETSVGAFSLAGMHVGMRGTLTTRTWVRGEPVRETSAVTTRYVSQRPGGLAWHNGEPAAATGVAERYDGGNLCEPPPGGGGWTRHAPARAVRGDSIPPELLVRR
ncbi:MAG TPA: hypothetical protein VF006_17465 [Longimicrobium sp.]